ncbi:MAG: hypothetical protein QXL17_05910 [Candidatus Thermoplasmatota archaeon]
MNKKIWIGCIGAAFLLLATSFTSAFGSTITKQNMQKDSPLFAVRTSQSVQQTDQHQFSTTYLGKGQKNLIIYKQSYQTLIAQLISILDNNPDGLLKILDRAMRMPGFKTFLQKNQIDQNELNNYVNRMRTDPILFKQELLRSIDMIEPSQGTNNPRPLALNTTNPFACVITVIALLPVFIILTLIIATVTLVTCLNINNCFENIFYSFIYQGLLPPQ